MRYGSSRDPQPDLFGWVPHRLTGRAKGEVQIFVADDHKEHLHFVEVRPAQVFLPAQWPVPKGGKPSTDDDHQPLDARVRPSSRVRGPDRVVAGAAQSSW
jgi:hypothetical protein